MAEHIKLEPNYDALYERFKREAVDKISDAFSDMPSMDCAEMAEKRDALRLLQGILAPINIALMSAVTVTRIQDMRDWLTDAVKSVQTRADALDNELNGWEPEEPSDLDRRILGDDAAQRVASIAPRGKK